MRTLGRRGEIITPLSQKSKIFASSPIGRAKAAFGGKLLHKPQFLSCFKPITQTAKNTPERSFRGVGARYSAT